MDSDSCRQSNKQDYQLFSGLEGAICANAIIPIAIQLFLASRLRRTVCTNNEMDWVLLDNGPYFLFYLCLIFYIVFAFSTYL